MPKRKRAEKTTNKDDAQDQSADNGDDDATKSDEFAKKPKQSKSKSTTLQTFEFNSDEDDDEPTMLQRQRQQQKQPHQQQQQFLVEQPTKPLQRPAKAVTLPPPVKPFPSFASATTTPANKDPVRLPPVNGCSAVHVESQNAAVRGMQCNWCRSKGRFEVGSTLTCCASTCSDLPVFGCGFIVNSTSKKFTFGGQYSQEQPTKTNT
jgi:hypothetical protein